MDPATAKALQDELLRLRTDLGEPGLSLAIRLPDGTVWTAVTGKAQVEKKHKRPVTPDTAFSAGSITKTFVGALVMQLVQRGALHLDDRVSNWLPKYPNAKHLLISELLQHTSGLYDYFDNPAYDPDVFGHPHHLWTVPEILSLVRSPYFAPGTRWHYSNTNFVLLGQILERATRAGVGNLIRNRLLKTQHLADTEFQDREPTLPDEANGYLWSGSGWIGWDDGSNYRPNPSAATVAWTAGAILATPSDLVRWAHALYAEGRDRQRNLTRGDDRLQQARLRPGDRALLHHEQQEQPRADVGPRRVAARVRGADVVRPVTRRHDLVDGQPRPRFAATGRAGPAPGAIPGSLESRSSGHAAGAGNWHVARRR